MQITMMTDQGTPERANEDLVVSAVGVSTGNLILLDGAGGPASMASGCSHGTPWYVRQLAHSLTGALLDDGRDLRSVLASAIEATAGLHSAACDLAHPGTPSTTAVLLRSADRDGAAWWDWLVLSDSTLILQQPDGTVQVHSDQRIDAIAPEHRAAMHRHPIGSEEHLLHRKLMVTEQRRLRNVEGGHWVAAADPGVADHALTGSIRPDELSRAAVMSDGAERWMTMHGLGPAALLDALERRGPRQIIAEVRKAEAADPDGTAHPRAKSVDDATVALIETG